MKTFATLLLALCCVLIVAGDVAFAQGGSNPLDPVVPKSKVLVGPRIGLNRNFHTGGFRTIDEPNCPVFEAGSGWGFIAGLTAEFQFGETWSLIPAIAYESRPGQFVQTLPDALVLIPGEEDPVEQTVTTESEITYSIVSAEVLYKQEFAVVGNLRFSAAAGPSFSYVIGGDNRQIQQLVEPENARFTNPTGLPAEDNGRRLVLYNDAIPDRSSIRLSLKGGLQAEIGLFNDAWLMSPGVFYDFGLTDVTDAENWGLSSIIFQIDMRRAF
jgi:hypothetical protein